MKNLTDVSLVIFTCEGREFLLNRTVKSFRENCPFTFSKTIIGVDGTFSAHAIAAISPDIVVQSTVRKGYVNNIINALKLVDTPYFFWLEDDWSFSKPVDLERYLELLYANKEWAEIFLSKFGPLNAEQKAVNLTANLYQSPEFSANPCICNTQYVKQAFADLVNAPKGETLGADGFENFLTKTFKAQGLKCVIEDPVDYTPISHEGYLESTPRSWHMTGSLEKKSDKHLLTIPAPSTARKLAMIIKLLSATVKLGFHQLFSNKTYEYCFRIIAMAKSINKNE
ncbi:hypothetical protein [Mucilaginibacter auburnensis]|uniref:Glycosyl transferase family 2 n=1 Tax=Mucilaginibacter auburnensis TaxID=1457233 RepID=A0A2H9VMC3_9SPHI|nr:hypothetical protein [Mucilaginibacter auburnensis]PJJ79453.1 hypothetical protein CLV57_2587 [Mucilaginibacter auburnensis]